MHISYQFYCKYRSACPILNSHLIYLCIFKAQKVAPKLSVIEAAIKNLREVRMDYWPQFRCKAESHLGILNEKLAIQNSSLILPLIREESTFVLSADSCYESQRCLYFGWFQNQRQGEKQSLGIHIQVLAMHFRANLPVSQDIYEKCEHHVWFGCHLLLVKEEIPTPVSHSTISLLFFILKTVNIY